MDNWAHLGGMATGLAAALSLFPYVDSTQDKRLKYFGSVFLLCFFVLFFVLLIIV